MNQRCKQASLFLIVALVLLLVSGCSSGEGLGSTDGDAGSGVVPDIMIAEIVLDAQPRTINVMEGGTLTATVYDESGRPLPGALVGFSLDRPSLAAVSPSIATSDGSGVARATLTARNQQGDVTVTALSGGVGSNARAVSILSGVSPNTINVTANPTTMLIEGTASIRAEVLDQNGDPVPDGTSVAFEVANPNFGSMATSSRTTINGFASSTFVAANQPGTASVEVSVGSINNSVDILINQTQPASLEFLSADPQRINLAGSGGTETSRVRFMVIDQNGNSVSGIKVQMNIEKGPNGGESIGAGDTPKEIEVSSDGDGIATVILKSGTTAGPVTIKASGEVGGVVFSASSSVVSIGGGVPSAGRFSVAANVLNIPGLNENNLTTDITTYMADRFGNTNILAGTTVSFWAEPALAVDASTATLNQDGLATVTARTQHPVIDPIPGGVKVVPFAWEEDLLDHVIARYGWPGETVPRDGLVSVLVFTQGEEHFNDLNANGVYDLGEPFTDTHDDPFIDYNDNGVYDAVLPFSARSEIYNDVNNTGIWNSYNGVWDSQKDIFHNFKILITGDPIIGIDPAFFSIPNGGSQSFTILVCDRNLNYLSAGTRISMAIKVDVPGGDDLVGLIADEVELDDAGFLPGVDGDMSSHLNRIEYRAMIYDKAPGTDFQVPVEFTVTVDWEGKTKKYTILGSAR